MTNRTSLAAAWVAACLWLPSLAGPRAQSPLSTDPPPIRGAARLLYGLPLDPNTAEARALEAIAGIGASRAEAIVDQRPYCALAELDRVRGIGPVTLGRLGAALAIQALPPGCERKLR